MLNYSCSPTTRERDTFPLSSSELELVSVSLSAKKKSRGTMRNSTTNFAENDKQRGGLHRAAQGVIEQAASLLC